MGNGRVLIVDDVMSARKLYSTLLMQKGHPVVEVGNGREAIDAIKEDDYGLIITDINMPRIDGLGLLTWLKKREKNIPVMVISAVSDRKTVMRVASYGIQKFLTKPINTTDFVNSVTEILGDPLAIEKVKEAPKKVNGKTSVFKQVMNRFSKKSGIPASIQPYTPYRFLCETVQIEDNDKNRRMYATLQAIHQELDLWRNSPRMQAALETFQKAFHNGPLTVKLLCVEYLPTEFSTDEQLQYFKEWIFARDHRVRIKVVERLKGLKHKKAISILLSSEEDNVKAIRDAAQKILSQHRLSHLVIPILIHYSARQLPLPARYNRLLFHSNHKLVLEELTSFLPKATSAQLCFLVEMISKMNWHEGQKVIFKLTTHDDEKVRMSTIEALVRFREYSATIYLIKLFQDPVHDVQRQALMTLRESHLIKNGTKILLSVFDSNIRSLWELLPSMVKDMERSHSVILKLCSHFHGTTLDKRIENFMNLSKKDPVNFKRHIFDILQANGRERNEIVIQFLQEFNND